MLAADATEGVLRRAGQFVPAATEQRVPLDQQGLLVEFVDTLALDECPAGPRPHVVDDGESEHLQIERPGAAEIEDPRGGPLRLEGYVRRGGFRQECAGVVAVDRTEGHRSHVVAERGARIAVRRLDNLDPVA